MCFLSALAVHLFFLGLFIDEVVFRIGKAYIGRIRG